MNAVVLRASENRAFFFPSRAAWSPLFWFARTKSRSRAQRLLRRLDGQVRKRSAKRCQSALADARIAQRKQAQVLERLHLQQGLVGDFRATQTQSLEVSQRVQAQQRLAPDSVIPQIERQTFELGEPRRNVEGFDRQLAPLDRQ